jgi:hypothetical protein
MTYAEKLKDPRWQKKRLEILNRDEWMCQRCQDNESTLHVHHLSYTAGKEPWEYESDNFTTLCEGCHDYERETRPEYEKMLLSIIKSNGFMSDDVYEIVDGFLKLQIEKSPEVTASIIKFALSRGFQFVSDLFWEDTHKKVEQRKMKEVSNG